MDARQSLDRLSVQPLSRDSLSKHRRRARVNPKRPVRASGAREVGKLGERGDRPQSSPLRLSYAAACAAIACRSAGAFAAMWVSAWTISTGMGLWFRM